jgi:hypothetical protein
VETSRDCHHQQHVPGDPPGRGGRAAGAYLVWLSFRAVERPHDSPRRGRLYPARSPPPPSSLGSACSGSQRAGEADVRSANSQRLSIAGSSLLMRTSLPKVRDAGVSKISKFVRETPFRGAPQGAWQVPWPNPVASDVEAGDRESSCPLAFPHSPLWCWQRASGSTLAPEQRLSGSSREGPSGQVDCPGGFVTSAVHVRFRNCRRDGQATQSEWLAGPLGNSDLLLSSYGKSNSAKILAEFLYPCGYPASLSALASSSSL